MLINTEAIKTKALLASGQETKSRMLAYAASISDASQELSKVPEVGRNSTGYVGFCAEHANRVKDYNTQCAQWDSLRNDLPGWTPISSKQASDVAEDMEALDLGLAPVVIGLIIAGIIAACAIGIPAVYAFVVKVRTWRENSTWEREHNVRPTPYPSGVGGLSTTQLLMIGGGALLLIMMIQRK